MENLGLNSGLAFRLWQAGLNLAKSSQTQGEYNANLRFYF